MYAQFVSALGHVPDYWYWGHLHNAIVYQKTTQGYLGRCVGNGAEPYGKASVLDGHDTVQWYETKLAGDQSSKNRVLNGFAHIQLNGVELHEQLIGEDGTVWWES
jgi:hypothetical protein